MTVLKLGLIGDNIAASMAPRLHGLAGELIGREVTYERLVPRERGQDFEEVFEHCRTSGFRGINVTHPYKEVVARMVDVQEELVRRMGAVNTVLFEPAGPWGYNTDHSGFVTAYREARADEPPGSVALLGAGGVGKAIAFGLLAIDTKDIRITDPDQARAEGLAEVLVDAAPDCRVTVSADAEAAAEGCTGLINCSPVGMVGYEGTPIAPRCMQGADWAFDAVYTPVKTTFLNDANALGLEAISGYELFFHQGVHCFQRFAGVPLDADALRVRLDASTD